jgi:predicted nucleic acid-binding protein
MHTKVLFDTSVIIPGLLESHPNHKACISWLSKGYQGDFQIGVPAHCLAEVYAGLTAMPSSPKIRPVFASQAIDDLVKHAKIIELTSLDYQNAIERCVLANLTSGVVYDSLIAIAAEKFKADCLLTFNKRDFSRLLGKHVSIMKSPG